jgi:hypothetical protein
MRARAELSAVVFDPSFRARFCGEPVGARKDTRHSNFRYRWFRVWSQSLPSLGAFGGLVMARQARQSGTFSVFFVTFIFAAPSRELTGGCEYVLLESGDFGQGLEVCRVWVQSGLWCLDGGRAKTGRTGVLLHQVCKVCSKSAKSAPSLQSLHLAHLMHTL